MCQTLSVYIYSTVMYMTQGCIVVSLIEGLHVMSQLIYVHITASAILEGKHDGGQMQLI